VLNHFHNNKANTGRYFKASACKTCSNLDRTKLHNNGTNFATHLLNGARGTAKKRKSRGRPECSEMSLTKADVLKLKKDQNNRCVISGAKLKWKPNSGWKKASIDRIDNNNGYVKGNVRLLAWGINQALSDRSDKLFLKMCKKVVKTAEKAKSK
jgi:hypothetical protein